MIRLFRVFVPTGTFTMLVSELLWVTAAFVAATFLVVPTDPTMFLLDDNGIVRILLVVAATVVGLHFHDLYTDLYVKSRIILLQQLCMVAGIIFLLQGLISYITPDLRMPIRVMVVGSAMAIAVIFLWRLFFSAYVLQAVGRDRMLLVGSTVLLDEIDRYVADHPETGSQVVGYVTDVQPPGRAPAGAVVGSAVELADIIERTQPKRIIVSSTDETERLPVSELLDLRFNGQTVEDAANAYERVAGRVCLKGLRPSQMIFSGEFAPRTLELLYQTILYRALAFVGLVLTLPLMLLAAAAVKLTSRGSVFSRSNRVGLDGETFVLYKFRCMRSPDGEADIWIPQDDPRVTGVGRLLRLSRADELPQLFNVLRGDLSLIGPRPERPEFVQWLSAQLPCYRQRHAVRPGVTGWAQINRKDDAPLDAITSLEYDLYYIKNLSFSLDTFILAHTLKAIVVSRGRD
jgi:exopolysaccharide biosynthesis polyprenyl glycosylphosphotransferase